MAEQGNRWNNTQHAGVRDGRRSVNRAGAWLPRLRGMTGAMLLGVACLVGAVSVPGCDSTGGASEAGDNATTERVVLAGETFTLDLAIDDATRFRGLGGRESVAPDGGMLFVFKDSIMRQFVMRDCVVAIDIVFVNSRGRIVAIHTMPAEAPQAEGESDMAYELRLKKYSSGSPARFVIELAEGRAKQLGLQVGQTLDLDVEGLKARAK